MHQNQAILAATPAPITTTTTSSRALELEEDNVKMKMKLERLKDEIDALKRSTSSSSSSYTQPTQQKVTQLTHQKVTQPTQQKVTQLTPQKVTPMTQQKVSGSATKEPEEVKMQNIPINNNNKGKNTIVTNGDQWKTHDAALLTNMMRAAVFMEDMAGVSQLPPIDIDRMTLALEVPDRIIDINIPIVYMFKMVNNFEDLLFYSSKVIPEERNPGVDILTTEILEDRWSSMLKDNPIKWKLQSNVVISRLTGHSWFHIFHHITSLLKIEDGKINPTLWFALQIKAKESRDINSDNTTMTPHHFIASWASIIMFYMIYNCSTFTSSKQIRTELKKLGYKDIWVCPKNANVIDESLMERLNSKPWNSDDDPNVTQSNCMYVGTSIDHTYPVETYTLKNVDKISDQFITTDQITGGVNKTRRPSTSMAKFQSEFRDDDDSGDKCFKTSYINSDTKDIFMLVSNENDKYASSPTFEKIPDSAVNQSLTKSVDKSIRASVPEEYESIE